MIATGRPEDTTKPSRINRRRKKRWKNGLTNCKPATMLNSLSKKTKARDWHLDTSGTAATIAVFLCAKLLNSSSICRIGRSSRKTGRCSYWYANSVQSGTNDWHRGVGFISALRDIIMKNHAQIQAKSSHKTSIFNVYLDGQLILTNIPYWLIVALKQKFPELVIKFDCMKEAAQ